MIDPYGGSRTPDRLLMANDKKKLWIFVVLFIIVLASFFSIQIWGQLASKKKSEKEGQKPAVDPDRQVIDVAPTRDDTGRVEFAGEPQTVEDKRDLAENELSLNLGELAAAGELVDGREEDSPKVLDYLLKTVTWDYQVTALPEHVYRPLPEGNASHDASPHRGRLTTAFGELVSVGPMEDYPTDVEQVKQLQRAVFRTAGGAYYHIVTTMPVERNVGEWIQVYGIYFRNRPVEVDGAGQAAFSLVLSKKPAIAYPPTVVAEIDPRWAEEPLDQSYDQASRVTERPFWLLLNYAKNLGIEGFRQKKASGEIEVISFGSKARPLVRRADQYRLEFVSAIGKLITPRVEYMDHDNPGKIERMDSAVLLQPSQYLVRLVSPRPWDEYGIRVGHDFVRVHGVFYKRWQYIPRGGDVPLEIPLLVVTDIELVDKPSATANLTLLLIQVALVTLALGIVGFFVHRALMDRVARAEFRRRLLEKGRERKERSEDDRGAEE